MAVDHRQKPARLPRVEATRATLLLRLNSDGPERELAWSQFCDRYEPIIAGFARRWGAPPEEVHEIVQHVVAGFFAAQPRFAYDPSKGRFRGYLKACVRNRLRQSRRNPMVSIDSPGFAGDAPEQEADEAWDQEWERQRLALAVARVRADLGDGPTFQAFEAVTLRGQNPDQVAAALGLSRDSVYQAKSRVLARLRLAIDDVDAELGS